MNAELSYTLSGNGTDTITVTLLNFTDQLYGFEHEYLVLTFIDRYTTVDTTNSLEMVNTQFSFTLDGREKASNASNVESLGTVTFFLVCACGILLICVG